MELAPAGLSGARKGIVDFVLILFDARDGGLFAGCQARGSGAETTQTSKRAGYAFDRHVTRGRGIVGFLMQLYGYITTNLTVLLLESIPLVNIQRCGGAVTFIFRITRLTDFSCLHGFG